MILYERCCEWVMNGDHFLGIFNWLGEFFLFYRYHTHGCNEGVLFFMA